MQHVSSGGDERAIAAATQGLTPSWLHSREFNDSGCLQLELGLNRAKHAKLMLLYPNPILPIDW